MPKHDMSAMKKSVDQVAESCRRLKSAMPRAVQAINDFVTAQNEPFYNLTYAEVMALRRRKP